MSVKLHNLLRRQLVRFFGQPENIPDNLRGFVSVVNDAYNQFDDDRCMLERSLDMSSQELLQANSDMRAIFQVLPDLFFRLDSEGTIIDCKAGSKVDFYTNSQSLIGKRIQNIPEPEISRILGQAVRDMKRTKFQINVEYSLVMKGKKVHYEARFLPMPNNEMITVIRDISPRKEFERELQSREELLSATLESTADGILVVDENGLVTHSNARFAELWRIPQYLIELKDDSLILNHVLDQLREPEAFLERIQEIYRQSDISFDTIYFKDGRVFERLSSQLKRVGDRGGRVWSFREITERKLSEKRVESLNHLKEKLLEPGNLSTKLQHITNMVVDVLNADFARIWAIKLADRCETGCFHAANTGSPHVCSRRDNCLHLIASSGRYTHIEGGHSRVPIGSYKIGRIAAGEEPSFLTNDVANDIRVHNHDWAKELGLISFAGQRVMSAKGEPVGVLAFFSKKIISRDEFAFSEILANTASQVIQAALAEEQSRDLQEKLERAQRMESLGILAGGVAHDLNNMLGPLVGYPELILMKLPPDSPVRKQVERVGKAAGDAAEVIQDLLTLARRGRYELQPTDFNEIIRSYFDSPGFVKLRQKFQNVAVNVKLFETLPCINGSSAHLSKVMMNLIINAFEAMPHGGNLRIETFHETLTHLHSGYNQISPGDYVIVKVCDTGMGISQADMARIFEPYYSKKRMGTSGSGLGLSVVYGVVKDHHGFYDILSEVGKGTEFVLYFPVCEDTAIGSLQKNDVQVGTESILVIDDSIEQREYASDVLSGLGYKVSMANNGTDGVRILRERSVDLVMLDMIMEPGFDGLDTYREIIKLRPGQKVIIVSGFAATERVEQAQKLGAGSYVKKPYTREVIAKAIRKELDIPVLNT